MTIIWATSEWPILIRNALINPIMPLDLIEMKTSDFFD